VFHTSVGEAGKQHQIVFGEWERVMEVLDHVPYAQAGNPQHFGRFLARAVVFRLAHEQAEAFAGNRPKRSSGEGEQIRGQRRRVGEIDAVESSLGWFCALDAGIGDGDPIVRHGDLQVEAGLQIGLIEARERLAGVHGNEERVNVSGAVVAIGVACDGAAGGGDGGFEVQNDGVAAGGKIAARNDHVALGKLRFGGGSVDSDTARGAISEIEDDRGVVSSGHTETNLLMARHAVGVGSELQRQAIGKPEDLAGTVAGEIAGDALARGLGEQGHGAEQASEEAAGHAA